MVMQPRTMIAGSSEPGRNRGVAMPKDACGSGNIQPLSQGSQHLAHTLRSRLEAIKRRVQVGTEGGIAGLTAEGLDPLMPAVRTITYHGMDLGIRDVIVVAPAVGTREALCINALGRPRRLFISRQGWTGKRSPVSDVGAGAWWQAGQSSGGRGLSKR